MSRKRPEKDLENPPGQVVNPIPTGPDTLQHNIEQWKRYEESRKGHDYFPRWRDGCCHKTVLERCTTCPFRENS